MTSPSEEYRTIALTQGRFAIVDAADYEELSKYRWQAEKPTKKRLSWRAGRALPRMNGRQRRILMHRQIMGVADPKIEIDHINGDDLDNRRSNLRTATRSQNGMNRPVTRRNKLGVKSVYRHQGGYRTYIGAGRKRIDLGVFPTIEAAADAYNAAALRLHGEFARPGGVPFAAQ